MATIADVMYWVRLGSSWHVFAGGEMALDGSTCGHVTTACGTWAIGVSETSMADPDNPPKRKCRQCMERLAGATVKDAAISPLIRAAVREGRGSAAAAAAHDRAVEIGRTDLADAIRKGGWLAKPKRARRAEADNE